MRNINEKFCWHIEKILLALKVVDENNDGKLPLTNIIFYWVFIPLALLNIDRLIYEIFISKYQLLPFIFHQKP